MLVAALVATLALGVPDVSRRTTAVRVVDSSFSTYDCSQACTQPPDSTRDTACIQHAIDQVSTAAGDTFASVEMPSGYCYIEDTLTADSLWGFELYGRGVHNTQLTWVGVSAVNVIELSDMRQANVHDFSIFVTTTDADAAIATTNGGGVSVAPTANHFHDLFISTTGGALLADGLRFDDTGAGGDNNQEFYSVERVHVSGYQSNAFNVMGGQMKGMHFADCTCASDSGASASTCVTSYGCFDWQGGGGGGNTYYDFALMNNGCPYAITGGNFENSAKFLYTPGPSGATNYTTVIGNRWSSIGGMARGATGADRQVVSYSFSGGLTMIGNTIGDDGVGAYTMTADDSTNVITLTGSPDLAVDTPIYFTTTNTLPNPLVANTTYYVKTAPTSTTATLAATEGGSTIDITTTGTGVHTGYIVNFRPIALYLSGGATALPYVLINNYIGTSLTGTNLFPYYVPPDAVSNTYPIITYSGGAVGTAQFVAGTTALNSTISEEITGSVGTTETAYSDPGAYATVLANTTNDNDGFEIYAVFHPTGVGGAVSIYPKVYWGGKASGVSICVTQGIAISTSDAVQLHGHVWYDTSGASPSWWSECQFTTDGNQTFNDNKYTWGQTGQPTTADILVEGTITFNGGTPNSSDKVKLTKLYVQRLRAH